MLQKKIHSEIKFSDPDFNIKIGTTNKKKPEVVYVQIGTYLKPNEDKNTYYEDIKIFDKLSKNYLSNKLKNSSKYNKDFILITDIADERMNINKKSFLEIQIHLKRYLEKDMTFKTLTNDLYSEHITDFIYFLKENLKENGFEYCKNKK